MLKRFIKKIAAAAFSLKCSKSFFQLSRSWILAIIPPVERGYRHRRPGCQGGQPGRPQRSSKVGADIRGAGPHHDTHLRAEQSHPTQLHGTPSPRPSNSLAAQPTVAPKALVAALHWSIASLLPSKRPPTWLYVTLGRTGTASPRESSQSRTLAHRGKKTRRDTRARKRNPVAT
jgi:hypothetical protein